MRKPRRINVEVFDPVDGKFLAGTEFPYDRWEAARGSHSRFIRGFRDLAQKMGRPDGMPTGGRRFRTRTRLIYP